MWSRVQTVTAIEGGTLAAWYKVWTDKHFCLSIVLPLVGAVLLFGVWMLMKRDAQYMDCYQKIAGDKIPIPEEPYLGFSGRQMARWFPLFLIIVNIVLAVFVYVFKGGPKPAC